MGVRRSRRLAELAAKKCKKVVACDSSKVVRSSCAQTEFGHMSFSAHGGDYELGDIPISQIERLGNGQFQWNRYAAFQARPLSSQTQQTRSRSSSDSFFLCKMTFRSF